MEIDFTKMHTNGSDYIYIDCFHNNIDIELVRKNIKHLCDRNFGIGGNGLILILPSDKAQAKVIVYNKNGSETAISGNGLCAVAKYLYENKLVLEESFEIEATTKIYKVNLKTNENEVENVTINIGHPNFIPKKIPVITDKSFFINEKITVNDENYRITCLSIDNPHAVIFTKYIYNLKIHNIGPIIESYHLFPQKINVDFVEIINKNNIKLKIWERDSGETLSCGTGACAAVVAGIINNKLNKHIPINVIQDGGTSKVEYTEDGIILTTKTDNIYRGKVLIKN